MVNGPPRSVDRCSISESSTLIRSAPGAWKIPARTPGPAGRWTCVPLAARRARLVQQDVGQSVREVARHGHEAVVSLGVDGDGPGTERGDEAVHEPEALGRSRAGRSQEPRRTFEQLGGGAFGSSRLGAADRM